MYSWIKVTVSSTFSMIQPCPLFFDVIENLFSLSVGNLAWVDQMAVDLQAIE